MGKHIVDGLEISSLAVKDSEGTTREIITSEGFKQVRWRDEYAGGEWGDGVANTAPAMEVYTIGGLAGVRKLVMDSNDARTNVFEIPHDMLLSAEASLQPELHMHFRPTTNATGTVIVYLTPEWSKANVGGEADPAAPTALPEMSFTCEIATGLATYPHYICAFGQLPVHSYLLGDLIGVKVERRTGFGTYTDDIILEKVAMHVPVDDRGSRQMYVK